MQLNGLWKCKNGMFVRIERKEGGKWIGEVIENYPIEVNGKPFKPLKTLKKEVIYLDNGNAYDLTFKEFDLVERKRGDEKGWPK